MRAVTRSIGLLMVMGLLGVAQAQVGPVLTSGRGLPVSLRPSLPAGARLEFRGSWVHWQDFASEAAARKLVAKAQQAGLNVLLPLANYPVMYRSALFPLWPRIVPEFDPMRFLVQTAHAAGLEVHPYFVLGYSRLTGIARERPDWWVWDRQGRSNPEWVDLAKPEVREFLTRMVVEVLAAGVDGVQFDYIRYAEAPDSCYDPYCRQRFREEHGADPLQLVGQGAPAAKIAVLQLPYHRETVTGATEWGEVMAGVQGVQPAATVLPPEELERANSTILLATGLRSELAPSAVLRALIRFIRRGNALLILDPPTVVHQDPWFASAIGLSGSQQTVPALLEVEPVATELGSLPAIPRQIWTGEVRCRRSTTARLLARTADGLPLTTAIRHGRGWVVVFNGQLWRDAETSNLLSGWVAWLAAQTGIPWQGRAEVTLDDWHEWRCRQVSETVAQMSAALRQRNPALVISATAGTRAEDKRHLFRDGRSWLQQGWVDYLCPMLYVADLGQFRRRLEQELGPVQDDVALRARIYPGIGAYRLTSVKSLLDQIHHVRSRQLQGVCLFAFEHLGPDQVQAIAAGPWKERAAPPWWRAEGR